MYHTVEKERLIEQQKQPNIQWEIKGVVENNFEFNWAVKIDSFERNIDFGGEEEHWDDPF